MERVMSKWQGVPPKAIQDFLNRKLDDYRTAKDISDETIQELYDQLPITPPIWRILKREQKICFLIGAWTPRFYFALDLGMGKTLLSIALGRYFNHLGYAEKIMVLVPRVANKEEWGALIRKHTKDVPYLVLKGSTAEKWRQLETSNALFVIETYPGFRKMISRRVSNGKKTVEELDPGRMRRMAELMQGMIYDELTQAKTQKSLIFKIASTMSKSCKFTFGLSGTPFGRNPHDLWAQMFLVDLGETLGRTLSIFRAVFFNTNINYWGGYEYIFKRTLRRELHRTLMHRMIRFKADESTLPPVSFLKQRIPLPKTNEPFYRRAIADLRAAKGNIKEIENAFLRLRQISSGFVGYKHDAEKGIIDLPDNPKLELLITMLQSLDEKAVVFHDFIYSGKLIKAELDKLGIKYSHIYGYTRDHEKELSQFADDKDCKVMLLNSSSGAYGLDRLKAGKYGIYYESPVPAEIRFQSERRVRRQLSKHKKVFLIDLVVTGTMDDRILQFHAEGKDLFQSIIEGKI
jgi:SNF2 family DNA or RNA helicase